jgi:hypothetical protein
MCISTNDLCLKCSKKLKEGEVSQVDIDVGRTIINASKQYKSLKDITLDRIILSNSAAYLLVSPGDKERFRSAGYIFLNELSDVLGNEIIFLEKSGNVKQFIDNLFSPIHPLSATTIYIPPNGEKELKITFNKNDKNKIKLKPTEVSLILKNIYGYGAHYSFN